MVRFVAVCIALALLIPLPLASQNTSRQGLAIGVHIVGVSLRDKKYAFSQLPIDDGRAVYGDTDGGIGVGIAASYALPLGLSAVVRATRATMQKAEPGVRDY